MVLKFITLTNFILVVKLFEMIIRNYVDRDWPQVWEIIEPVFRAGETYAFSPNITEEEAYRVWIEIGRAHV